MITFSSQAMCKRALLAGFALPLMLFAAPAGAAPQILAVASADLPVSLSCEKGECSAELTAICLQEHRASPHAGQEYYVHDNQKLALSLVRPDGDRIDLSNLPLTIRAARGHNAVQVSLAETRLRGLGDGTLMVTVPEGISLIPVPIANDAKPQTEADILLATGPLRSVATRLVDRDQGRANAARLVNQAINALPGKGRASPSERETALAFFSGQADQSRYPDQATTLARDTVRQCFEETVVGFRSFRQCLGSSHDQLIGKLNTRYWRSLNAGS
ncbi:hypothetical protein [Sneathiella chinensis]|uniref:Lysozyme inhibitor LprI N-terminal domain-containing protein n=1 Tax=Sneathiella chinensis TaxID=349750 RepID=A0ABQ5U6I3_9PROT|nr:hypothetical protein [Sneathiella chinensis]GLQ07529.1 hypothetical protein GCM10007924_27500 [Sneathiella chinensis]